MISIEMSFQQLTSFLGLLFSFAGFLGISRISQCFRPSAWHFITFFAVFFCARVRFLRFSFVYCKLRKAQIYYMRPDQSNSESKKGSISNWVLLPFESGSSFKAIVIAVHQIKIHSPKAIFEKQRTESYNQIHLEIRGSRNMDAHRVCDNISCKYFIHTILWRPIDRLRDEIGM